MKEDIVMTQNIIKKTYEKPSMKVYLLNLHPSLLAGSPDLPTGNDWPDGNPKPW